MVFDLTNGNGQAVKPVSTREYFEAAKNPVSPRPVHSALDLSKIMAAGYTLPADWEESLKAYVKAELAARGGSVEGRWNREGYYSCGWFGYAVVSVDDGHVEAVAAGV